MDQTRLRGLVLQLYLPGYKFIIRIAMALFVPPPHDPRYHSPKYSLNGVNYFHFKDFMEIADVSGMLRST